MMRKGKGRLLRQTMSVLLSAVLVAGMLSNAVPTTVLAQEGGSAAEAAAPGTNEAKEPGTVSGNDGEAMPAPEPQSVMTAAEKGWNEGAAYIAVNAAPAEKHDHDDRTFIPWDKTDCLPAAAGNYYLTADVTLTAKQSIPSATEIGLCLNGHTVTQTGESQEILTLAYRSVLTLCDCSPEKTGQLTGGTNGAINSIGAESHLQMYGGSITGNSGSWAVCVLGSFTMNGGSIKNNQGTGVLVEHCGSFIMNDGEIAGNTAAATSNPMTNEKGGGVYINSHPSYTSGSFTMNGGKIKDNTARWGGGVYLNLKESDGCSMNGGEITNNTATYREGGGVYLLQGMFTVGGRITDNSTADERGGGIYISRGEVSLTGDVYIQDNTAQGKPNNVYLPDGKKLSVTGDTLSGTVGVTTQITPSQDASIDITNAGSDDYSLCFLSDLGAPYVMTNSEANVIRLQLKTSSHIHKVCGDADCTDGSHTEITWTEWDGTDSLPTRSGNYCLMSDVALTGEWLIPDGVSVSLCLNGHTIRQTAQGKPVIEGGYQSSFLLCDCSPDHTGRITGGSRGGVDMSGAESSMTMYGGLITGNSGPAGAVIISGSFTMHDGEIRDNAGRGVYVNFCGEFFMFGGEIKGNRLSSGSGGGVYVDGYRRTPDASGQGFFQMEGGRISGNSAPLGGGVAVGDPREYAYEGIFSMIGGEITDNTAGELGGGLYLPLGTAYLGGSAVIRDNTAAGKTDNVYLLDNQILFVYGSPAFSEQAYIGVTTQTGPGENTPVTLTSYGHPEDCSPYFHSDNDRFRIAKGDNNAILLELKPHSHTLVRHPAVPPTHTEAGTGEYWKCEGENGCDKMFSDEEGKTQVDSVPAGEPALGHTFSQTWEGNETGHWHQCSCGEKTDIAEHEDNGGEIQTYPTETETGLRIYSCKFCGYLMRTEVLDKLKFFTVTVNSTEGGFVHIYANAIHYGSTRQLKGTTIEARAFFESKDYTFMGWMEEGIIVSNDLTYTFPLEADRSLTAVFEKNPAPSEKGEISKDVERDDTAPDTSIPLSAEELADLVLTEAEKQQTENGTDIKILLEVKDASASVSAADRAVVEEALQDFSVGQYLDISLYKLIAENRSRISETASKIRLVINVPDSLKPAGAAETRIFAVIRVHDGQAEFLEDLDDNADTVTIETDRFSTYTLAYRDGGGTGDNGNTGDGGGTGDNGNTGDDSDTGDNGNTGDDSDTGDNGSAGDDSDTGDNGSAGDDSDTGNPDAESAPPNSQDRPNTPPVKDNEPKTDGPAPVIPYATLAMIAGFAYLSLYFREHHPGMTEDEKKELTARMIRWARRGGYLRRIIALGGIFLVLVYYHSIGKKASVKWKEIYER